MRTSWWLLVCLLVAGVSFAAGSLLRDGVDNRPVPAPSPKLIKPPTAAVQTPTRVDGAIVSVDATTGACIVSLEMTARVAKGNYFTVTRGTNYITTLRVEYVEGRRSVAAREPELELKTPNPGDYVRVEVAGPFNW